MQKRRIHTVRRNKDHSALRAVRPRYDVLVLVDAYLTNYFVITTTTPDEKVKGKFRIPSRVMYLAALNCTRITSGPSVAIIFSYELYFRLN
jgi:hypothetical protein